MKIYVDFDDVLSETALALSELLPELFGKRVAYEDIHAFNLRDSFHLTEPEYRRLMVKGHESDFLESIAPTPNGCETLRAWLDKGWEPVVVTGRPASSHEASRAWLARYGLSDIPLVHVDKYNRNLGTPSSVPTYSFPQLHDMKFALAIDDAPPALTLLNDSKLCPAIIFNRPWNKTYSHDGAQRVADWKALNAVVENRADT